MSQLPQSVRIREVGPRDGFQNEPEVIPTAEKVRLIGMLARSGLRRIEVTSFVRPDVIPQLADAEQVLAAIERADGVAYSVLIPNERGLERALAQRDRFDEVSVFLSASETHNRKNVNRSIAESLAGLERVLGRAREEGLRCEGVISTSFGCPYEGEVPPERVLEIAERLAAAGLRGGRLRRHHRDGEPAPGRRVLRRRRASGSASVELTAHFHNTRGQGLANVLAALEQGDRVVRVGVRRARRLPGAARARPATSRPRTWSRCSTRWGSRPGSTCRELIEASRAVQEVLGRPLGAHVLAPGRWSGGSRLAPGLSGDERRGSRRCEATPSAPPPRPRISPRPSELFADDVVFRSPVVFKPYEGRDAIEVLLGAVVQVFEDFRYIDQVETGDTAVLMFEARVGDRELQGVDILRFDDDGRIAELTVMVRPMSGVHALAEAMQRALEAAGAARRSTATSDRSITIRRAQPADSEAHRGRPRSLPGESGFADLVPEHVDPALRLAPGAAGRAARGDRRRRQRDPRRRARATGLRAGPARSEPRPRQRPSTRPRSSALYVHPDRWREGVGRTLVAEALRSARGCRPPRSDRLDAREQRAQPVVLRGARFCRRRRPQRRPSFGSPLEVRSGCARERLTATRLRGPSPRRTRARRWRSAR